MRNTISVKNVSISYVEQNPSAGQTLFFIHGNSGSSAAWSKQFSDPLLAGYRLVAFDLPGHGETGPLPNAHDYNLPFIAEVMVAAVSACLTNEEYILVGFSLGTNIVAEMLEHNIYPKGIILIGACIVGKEYPMDAIGKEGFDTTVLFTDDCTDERLENFLGAAFLSNDREDHERFVNDYRKVKPPFRSMLLKTLLDGKVNDEIQLINRNAGVPILMIYGRDEKIVNPYYLGNASLTTWNNTIYKIAGASHFVHTDQAEATNRLIIDYCRDYFTTLL